MGYRDGFGILYYADGSIYEGNFKKSKCHGKGRLINSDGDVYEGDWMDGMVHGEGKYRIKNGPIYVGEWKEDKKWGEAEVVSTNGYKEAPILFEVKYSLLESKNMFLFFIFIV